jgi:hypothetical protein
MLPLDSPRWEKLTTCFGHAQRIAEGIQAVYHDYEFN